MKKLFFWLVFLLFIISLMLAVYVFLNYSTLIKKEVKTDKKEIFVCSKNEDCMPDNPLLGLNYVCKDGECVTEVLANPASTNCQERGGKVVLIERAGGGSYGVCKFNDGTECEEWKFLKEECFVGDFNPADNIWEGSIKLSQSGRQNAYFEMLNGEELGITSSDRDIQDILNALIGKNANIKVIGNITDNSEAFSGRELIVTQIIDLGKVSFNGVNLEESLKLAMQEIEKNSDFISNKGKNLELFETIKIDCPYCWNFIFTYASGKKIVFLDVIMKEGLISDMAEIDGNIYKNCDEFALAEVCTEQYEPVCAKIENINNANSLLVEWDNFSNPCKACIYTEEDRAITWYKNGECQ